MIYDLRIIECEEAPEPYGKDLSVPDTIAAFLSNNLLTLYVSQEQKERIKMEKRLRRGWTWK